jgi:restriction system protein
MTGSVAQFLAQAREAPAELCVNDLLAVWGFRARTWESVDRLRRDLSAAGLGCEPDLGDAGYRSIVRVAVVEAQPDGDDPDPEPPGEHDEQLRLPVTLLVSQIPSASSGIARVSPNHSIGQAQAIMSARDYSQLAVMTSDRDLVGAVSWKTIAQKKLGKPDVELADATMKPAPVVPADDELLRHLGVIYEHDFAFVRGDDGRIRGIVTTADLTYQFRDLTTPFFQLGEIERRLRRRIDQCFSGPELHAVFSRFRNKPHSASGMEFGQYTHLLGNDDRWKRIGFDVDQVMFLDYLEQARKIRNKVMHFGEDLTAAERSHLKQCLAFIRAIDPLP